MVFIARILVVHVITGCIHREMPVTLLFPGEPGDRNPHAHLERQEFGTRLMTWRAKAHIMWCRLSLESILPPPSLMHTLSDKHSHKHASTNASSLGRTCISLCIYCNLRVLDYSGLSTLPFRDNNGLDVPDAWSDQLSLSCGSICVTTCEDWRDELRI